MMTRAVHFGGEDWQVTEHRVGEGEPAHDRMIAFHTNDGISFYHEALASLTMLSDRDLRDLLLLALLAH